MLSFKQFLLEENNNSIFYNDPEVEHEGHMDVYNNKVYTDSFINHQDLHEGKSTAPAGTHRGKIIPPEWGKKKTITQAISAALRRHKEAYGEDLGPAGTQKPSRHKQDIIDAIDDHFSKSPDDQKIALNDAANRLGHFIRNGTEFENQPEKPYTEYTTNPIKLAAELAKGNTKTDTIVKNPLATFNGKQINYSSSYGGTPAQHTHYEEPSMTKAKVITTCANKTDGCSKPTINSEGKPIKPGCLAMSGNYLFNMVKIPMEIRTHAREGRLSNKDFSILTAQHILNQGRKASKNGMLHAIRTQTTDQQGRYIESIVDRLAEHYPELHKNTVLTGYSKDPKEILEAARRRKAGVGVPRVYAQSNTGPAYYEGHDGKLTLNPSSIVRLQAIRDTHEQAEKEGLVTGDYVVVGGHPLTKDPASNTHVPDKKRLHVQPDKIKPSALTSDDESVKKRVSKALNKTQQFVDDDSIITNMRYWDLHHSGELPESAPDSHHNGKTGKGYGSIIVNGKRVRINYHDRPVNIGATPSGRTSYKERHDGRFSDAETSRPNSQVTAPVASTRGEEVRGDYPNSLFHQYHTSVDPDGTRFAFSAPGTLHDAHPHLMVKAGYTYPSKPPRSNKHFTITPTE